MSLRVDPAAYDKNLSPPLVIFDRSFGTFYLPDDQTLPECYGVSDFVPDGFWEQMIHPFITVKKRVSRGAMDTPRQAETLLAE